MAKRKVEIFRNQLDWFPSDNDYQLVFMDVDGFYRECGHCVPSFSDMLLSDFLSSININIPDYTNFLRIYDPERNLHFEYRSYGGLVRIDVKPLRF